MAVLSAMNPTLLDVAKRLDPDGNIDKIVELMNLTNEIIDDSTFLEGNLPTGHKTTVRTGIPTPTWRKLYGGVQPTKSTTAQITDNTGMLEAYAEIDKALADLNGNTAAFRMSEERAFIEGMNQEFASTLIYGNEGTEPEAFTGLAPRYNSLAAANGVNIVDCGGTDAGDQTSVWLVCWGPNTAHCIYPKGSKAGLSMEDKGQVTIENADGSNGRMEAYRSHYRWDSGFTLRDWRYVVRIANIDVSDLKAQTGTQAVGAATNILRALIEATELLPSMGMGRCVFYSNRVVRTQLRNMILSRTVNQLTWETVSGKKVISYDGIPFRRVDAILRTEDPVV
ncbi:MAG: major capsid protein [Candidatus Binatia bacterium]